METSIGTLIQKGELDKASRKLSEALTQASGRKGLLELKAELDRARAYYDMAVGKGQSDEIERYKSEFDQIQTRLDGPPAAREAVPDEPAGTRLGGRQLQVPLAEQSAGALRRSSPGTVSAPSRLLMKKTTLWGSSRTAT